jgi:hypothetical protein
MNINLTLSVQSVELILAALGKAPYEQVADLIQSIKEQAIPQVSTPAAQPEATTAE